MTPMKRVVIMSMVVRFTVRAASKYWALKNVVPFEISMRRMEGRKVVIISFINFLCRVNVILTPLFLCLGMRVHSVTV